jgi:hypothetical protein
MERNRLRACTGMGYAYLNPILEKLAKERRIRVDTKDIVSIIYYLAMD